MLGRTTTRLPCECIAPASVACCPAADLGPVGMRPMDIRRGVRIRRATTRPRSTGSHLLDWGLGVTGRWLISDKVASPFFLWVQVQVHLGSFFSAFRLTARELRGRGPFATGRTTRLPVRGLSVRCTVRCLAIGGMYTVYYPALGPSRGALGAAALGPQRPVSRIKDDSRGSK